MPPALLEWHVYWVTWKNRDGTFKDRPVVAYTTDELGEWFIYASTQAFAWPFRVDILSTDAEFEDTGWDRDSYVFADQLQLVTQRASEPVGFLAERYRVAIYWKLEAALAERNATGFA